MCGESSGLSVTSRDYFHEGKATTRPGSDARGINGSLTPSTNDAILRHVPPLISTSLVSLFPVSIVAAGCLHQPLVTKLFPRPVQLERSSRTTSGDLRVSHRRLVRFPEHSAARFL